MIPFSLCNEASMPGSKNSGTSVGIPIPRLTENPSLISFAALLAILCRWAIAAAFSEDNDRWSSFLARVTISIRFSVVAGTMRSTYMPGTWIALGDRDPTGTICSA